MRFGRLVVVLLVAVAVSAPVALAFGFDDGVKPPRGILDTPYTFTFKGRNGCPPYTFVFQNGSLPPGLSMNAEGVIAGVPTAVGRYSFWVELRDSGCRGGSCPPAGTSCSFPSQRPFTIDIVAPLTVAAPPRIVAENGVRLTATTIQATGGRGPYVWELARAPDWLVVGTRGTIAGTPTAPGRFHLTIALKLAITTSHLRLARVGRSDRAPLSTNGGVAPFRWSVTVGRFPVGVRLDTSTGVLVGAPRTTGSYPLRVTVKDALGITASKRLTLRVAIAPHHRPAPPSHSASTGA